MESVVENKLNSIQLLENPKIETVEKKYIHSVQSANVLFKFFIV